MSQKKRKASAEIFGAANTGTMADDEEQIPEFTIETRDALPAHLLIKIQSFSLLSEHGIEKYESRDFEAGGYKWRLIIHPNGPINSEDEDTHISAYLTVVKTDTMPMDWEVNAIFRIFLHNQISDNYICFQGKMWRFHALRSQWGFSKLISKGSLRAPGNGFLVDDNCVFGAEVLVMNKSQRIIEHMSLLETDKPYKREWKIPEFSKLGEAWHSEEFTAGDKIWMLVLYPNGYEDEEGRSVSMFLESVSSKSFAPHEKVKAYYRICIKNQLNAKHRAIKGPCWFTSSSFLSGWPAFIPLSVMRDANKGFTVKDCCCVELELSVQAVVREAL